MDNIVVLGAGYAGMTAAVGIAGRGQRVTLVNNGARFTERLRLHQVAAGQQLPKLSIPELLDGTGVEFVDGWVGGIDLAARTVRVGERVIGYDRLVYALGGVPDTAGVPGVEEYAFTLDQAEAVQVTDTVVCGTGLTGVETAAELAEAGHRVVLVGRAEPGAELNAKARAYLQRVLGELGVEVRRGEVVKVLRDEVVLDSGETISTGQVIWAGGVRGSELARAAGLEVDELDRVVTDAALRSVSHPEVYAVGDAAAVRQEFGVLHGTCQSGMPTGVHAATSIVRELRGKAPKRFRFGYLHAPVSLGRRHAVVQFTRPDGTAKRAWLSGRVAVWYKETVSSAPWPSFRRMVKVPASGTVAWRRGGRYTR
ncbi:NAD(P)/FAD-dependent oxidoreductase [Actinokineospora inagensis]|uniref:NAD(P)/FAD-dependent oxidoreductase n=1 Tax=Actinokineospora inagensis TaxID=103730 RepID=UPI000412F2B7|nr:FAD-dependent oxidoreductase [Actinokineospora inagensis]